MDISSIFKNDINELNGKKFYYSRRFVKGDFNVIKPYTHEHYEIYYLIRGSRKYFIKNKIYFLNPGDFVIIPPNTLHYTMSSNSNNHERILLNFTEDFIPSQIKVLTDRLCKKECITLSQEQRVKVEDVFTRISEEYNFSNKYSYFLETALLTELLIYVLRSDNTNIDAFCSYSGRENSIDNVLEYINNNLSEPISLIKAAKFTGLSKSHFAKTFKKMTGFTFNNYLQLQRLLKAQRMLKKTQNRITEIAEECGFSSSGYFSTVFKNYFGMSPLEYRKN